MSGTSLAGVLQALRITDLGVISDVVIELVPGLCVVTGETGAGKTMVVTGLTLLFGGRADASRVRSGAAQAGVEGRISVAADSPAATRALDAGGDLDDGELVLRRVVTATGRSRAHVGGASAPVSVLSAIGEHVVAVHGQADQTRLVRTGEQRAMLDRFAGMDLQPYRAAFSAWQQAAAQYRQRVGERAALRREGELLRFGLDEIERAKPYPGEDVALTIEAARLAAADELRLAAGGAHDALAGNADDPVSEVPNVQSLIARAHRALVAGSDADPALAELAQRVGDLGAGATDLASELASYTEGIDADPRRLSVVEQRRADLFALTRKYGTVPQRVSADRRGAERSDSSGPTGVDSVLDWARAAAARLELTDTSDDAMDELRRRSDEARAEVERHAIQVSTRRRAAATDLAARVGAELGALSMADAQLTIDVRARTAVAGQAALEIDGRETGVTADGVDEVEFLLRPYADSPALPLNRGASGGELSRVMLALEVALAGTDPVPVMVFDEVDAGVGGRAAVEVGRRLSRLAREHQVIVVTHLAQVAAFADAHYVVGAVGGSTVETATDASADADGTLDTDRATVSSVVRVVDAQRISELARMLAGRDTDAAREHAAELLADADRDRAERRQQK